MSSNRNLSWLFALSLLSACGGGSSGGGDSGSASSSSTASENTAALATDLSGQLGSSMTKASGVMELTISGLGSKNPQTEAKWVSAPGAVRTSAGQTAASTTTASMSTDTKTIANTVALPNFLDVAGFTTSTIDNGGFRHIAATIKVRNAPQCPVVPGPGNCAGYLDVRRNVTFFAVLQDSTINQTAVSRFRRFDGSDANPALTTQLLPAHGLEAFGVAVDPKVASMQVYRESELPTPDAGVISVFPYGFVVRNVNDGSRVLPANPAPGQYDGIVTFGFKIPLQTPATEDPFKISLRFQTADDNNLRVTQSLQEHSFFGDLASSDRALNLSGVDLAVLGGRVAQTTIGDPICSVRTAGPAGAATAYLVNNTNPAPNLAAAPMNLSFVDRTSSVSLGFCEDMSAPNPNTLIVNGSQSGRRSNAGFASYNAVWTGGIPQSPLSLNRPNQLVLNITGQRSFFPGEEVSFTATSGNQTFSGVPITPFVGSFRVRGSIPSNGLFFSPVTLPVAMNPVSVALGDLNGDGVLDSVTSSQTGSTLGGNLSIWLGNAGVGPTVLGPNVGNFEVKLGDINGDGYLDAVVGSAIGSTIYTRLGNGSGALGPASVFPTTGVTAPNVTLGDVNGDGRLDIVASGTYLFAPPNPQAIYVLLGDGSGGFGAATLFGSETRLGQVALGDVNNDGRLDIVTVNAASNEALVLIGDGNGNFAAASRFAVGVVPISLVLGDVNGDGRLDIVTANRSSNNVSVLIGNGGGMFGAASSFAAADAPESVKLGDINGDGKLDIVVSNFLSNNISTLLGNGNGGFAGATNTPSVSGPGDLALGDVNNDGRLDIVVTNFATSTLSVLVGY